MIQELIHYSSASREPRPFGEILQDLAKIDNELGRALRHGLQCVTPNDGKEVTDGE